MINDNDGINLLSLRRDMDDISVCNGLKNNLPFLINFIIDHVNRNINLLYSNNKKQAAKSDILNFIKKTATELVRGNYKIGFDNLFKNEKLLVYLSYNKLHINRNAISIYNIYELSLEKNIVEFSFEKFCDVVNLLNTECHDNPDVSSSDQTKIVNSFGEPFYEDKYVRVFQADTKEKAILYGTGYGFCISTTTGFNYFNKYRFTKMGNCGYETTIHFVFFKNKEYQNEKGMFISGISSDIFDKWNMCIIDLCYEDENEKNHVWYYTTSRNNGTYKTTPKEIKVKCKELEKITAKQLNTDISKYNNYLEEAFNSNKAFITKRYTDSELLLKDYSSEVGSTKEIKLDTIFKKPKRTIKDVFDDEKTGEIFADMLLSDMKDYNLSNEVIKYIYTKFDHSSTSGDSIIGKTKYNIIKSWYENISDALARSDDIAKINEAIGRPKIKRTKEDVMKLVEVLEKEEQENPNRDLNEPNLIH